MEDEECQEDELIALSSIYDERIFTRLEHGGEVNIFLEIPEDLKVSTTSCNGNKPNTNENYHHCVKYLPPLVLRFKFPSNYPSAVPPQFNLTCEWLNVIQLSKLCKSLDFLWEESPNEVILFRWIQFLHEETLEKLGICSTLVLTCVVIDGEIDRDSDARAAQNIASSSNLLDVILHFDEKERERVFEASHFSCGVCFFEKPGSSCIAFQQCKHVFCTECISEYFKVQIESGLVKALNCPETNCDSQALPSQVKKLVSPDLFAKYDKYLLQSSLNEMSDIVYCPRPTCQSPVILESDSTMGVCEVCRFAFCSLCKLTYHGISPCVFRPNEIRKLKVEYENGTESERLFLERRYGKNRIRRMIDDLISEEWLLDNSKMCPRCHAHIQKSEGCNKMHCLKCRTNFCWLCGKILDQHNPYVHFNTWNSTCFNRLFEGVDSDSD